MKNIGYYKYLIFESGKKAGSRQILEEIKVGDPRGKATPNGTPNGKGFQRQCDFSVVGCHYENGNAS